MKNRQNYFNGIKVNSLLVFVILLIAIRPIKAGLWYEPDNFSLNINEGCRQTKTLTIGNDSNEYLNFALQTREVSRQILTESESGKTIAAAVEEKSNKIILEYTFSKPTISRESTYDNVQIDGLETYSRPGAPIIPVRPVTILVPFGKKVAGIRSTPLQKGGLTGSYNLPPAQETYPLSYRGKIQITAPDPLIYESQAPWPQADYEEVGTISKRGYQLLTVNLFPVHYIPKNGQIRYATKMRLEINLSDSAKAAVRPSPNTIRAIKRKVDNPNFLQTYDSQSISMEKLGLDNTSVLLNGGPYQYVIITNQALEGVPGPWNFQALRDSKISQGMTATIVTTEWIYSNYNGTRPDGGSDNQTRIRNFLVDAYQNWGTEYVLLGGTNGIVPARMFRVEGETMPVDMYYGCVEPSECTFDYNANGIYGEPIDGIGGGEIDLYAEIYVGRAAVENAAELSNFIQKTLAYNSTYNEYLPLISMLGEHLGFGGVAEYAKPAMEQIRLGGNYDGYFTCGFENHTQPDFYDFDTSTNLYDAEGFWPKSQLINLMNQGIHVFNHLGHANYTYDMKLYVSDLSALTNTDYFFAYSQGCNPGGFDTPNCFAEVITTMEHGAFAVIMNARSGWGRFNSTDGPSQRFARQFWDAALNEDMLELGRANQDSKEDNLWDINGSHIRWCYYGLNLFGDPAQKLKFQEACEWITLEPKDGIIAPYESVDVNVTFDAMALAPGEYEAEIIITSNDPNGPVVIPAAMTVNLDDLQITPKADFQSEGSEAGPFEPRCMTYTLTNNNETQLLSWTTRQNENWFAVEPNQGLINPSDSVEVSVCISPDANLLAPNIYNDMLVFQNTDSGSIKSRSVSLTVKPPDCFTESFENTTVDIEGLMITFMPDGSGSYYEACRDEVNEFAVDPNSGTYVELWDDDYAEVILPEDTNILFYGVWYDRFYIGSNGYITFGSGDSEYEGTLENHFILPRISGMFTDMTPQNNHCISYKLLDDSIAVTFENVQLFGDKNTKNSFQAEMFFVDGTIRMTWLDVNDANFVAGLSRGRGIPPVFFLESDLSSYPPCWPLCDFNKNYIVNFTDFSILAGSWLAEDCGIPYWCEKSDLDLSGRVDDADVEIFVSDWLMKIDWFLRPISHWRFDEGSGSIAYDSVGDNHGTLIGDTAWVSGKMGSYALEFDGMGDLVNIGNKSSLEPMSFTVAAWIKPQNITSLQQIAGKYGGEAEDNCSCGYRIAVLNDSKFGLYVDPTGCGNTNPLKSITSLQAGYWYFVAGTFDGSVAKVYVNGEPEAQGVRSLDGYYNDFYIGASYSDYHKSYQELFDGSIDDVRIYDRALSAEEIEGLYREGMDIKAFNPNPSNGQAGVDPNVILSWSAGKDALSHDVYLGTDFNDVNDANTSAAVYMGNFHENSFNPSGLELDTTYYWRIDELDGSEIHKGNVWSFTTWVEPNLLAHWAFEEGSGNIAYDSAGTNDGVLIGDPAWISGKIGDYALDFDGSGDYINIDSSEELKLNEAGAISVWVYPRNSYRKTIIGKKGSSTGANESENYWLVFDSSNGCRLVLGDGTYWGTAVIPAEDVNENTWFHVVGTWDSSYIKIYLNGELKDIQPNTLSDLVTSDSYPLRIGFDSRAYWYFDGLIDDVRIYNRTLSPEKIQELAAKRPIVKNFGLDSFHGLPYNK